MPRSPKAPPTPPGGWDIRHKGRAWTWEEWEKRRELCPEKFEMSQGKLFWRDEDRLAVLALMLENVGIDQAVRLGDVRAWREAIEEVDQQTSKKGSAKP